jgi:hypothetical protein
MWDGLFNVLNIQMSSWQRCPLRNVPLCFTDNRKYNVQYSFVARAGLKGQNNSNHLSNLVFTYLHYKDRPLLSRMDGKAGVPQRMPCDLSFAI